MQIYQRTNLIKIVLIWALSFSAYALPSRPIAQTKITGRDEIFNADVVELGDGTKGLVTKTQVTVEEILGQFPKASSWVFMGNASDASGVGSAGDTVTTTIAAAASPLDLVYPAISVVTTVTAGMLTDDHPERALATQICTDLDAEPDFFIAWKCIVIKDYSGVFIHSKIFNEDGERTGCAPITDCFNMVTTGTTVVTVAFNTLALRGLSTELSISPNNPRQGILGISGQITQIPGGAGDLLFEEFINGGSSDFIVDGSVTPVNFRIECDTIADKYINEIRQYLGCNGIKFGQFACKNGPGLATGVETVVRSLGSDLNLLSIKRTEDFKNKFAIGAAGTGGLFRIDIQAGGDQLVASMTFPQPAIIQKCGTNGTGTDDFISITINDNLTGSVGGNLSEYSGLVSGFLRIP